MKHTAFALRVLGAAAIAASLLTAPSAASPAHAITPTYRVAPGGATSGACGDLWSNPCDLQYALSLAAAGNEIWVAAGTYTPGPAESDSFVIPAGVGVYGGFDGVDDEWADRSADTSLTVLSGMLGVSGNSHHVVTINGPVDAATVLDGFTITYGFADGADPADRGGGLYCNGSDASYCNPTLAHLDLFNNSAVTYGGGMFLDARNGGEASPQIDHVNFTYNYSAGDGGGLYAWGASGGMSSPSLTSAAFSENDAGGQGGGAAFVGEGGKSEPVLLGVDFSYNSADGGGALFVLSQGSYTTNTDVKITNGRFAGNSADLQGGAILQAVFGPDGDAAGSSLSTVNTIFIANTAGSNGGAIYLEVIFDGAASEPTVWADPRGFLSLINTSTFGNSAPYGQGGAIYATADAGTNSSVSITNSVLWGDTDGADAAEVHLLPGTGGMITYTDIQGGCAPTGADCSMNHNLNSDPLYDDPDEGYLQLLSGSPAIDAGDNWALPDEISTDLDGNARYVEFPGAPNTGSGTPPIVDMGAHEFQFTCPAGPVIYVDVDAPGTSDGSSWANAFNDIAAGADALHYCSAPGSEKELWVAEGVYVPGDSPDDSLHVYAGMKMYGGFNGTETAREQRDYQAHLSILSGDLHGDDITTGGVVMHTAEIIGSNLYHVVWIDGEPPVTTANTILDGFVITGGNANGSEYPGHFGGGLYCDGTSDRLCSPTLRNMVFSGNYAYEAGGGIYNNGHVGLSSPAIDNSLFRGNGAGLTDTIWGAGGAIYNNGEGNDIDPGGSSPVISNSTFVGNWAGQSGGAMHSYAATPGYSGPSVFNSTFTDNYSNHYGGAVFNHADTGGTLEGEFVNDTFSGNSAVNGGGQMANIATSGGSSTVDISSSILWGGSATYGNDVINQGAMTYIGNSVITNAYFENDIWDASLGISTGGNSDADPLLASLADNGGLTETIALLPGSSAIDRGSSSDCVSVVGNLDQRGVARPQGVACDSGAFEHMLGEPHADFEGDDVADLATFDPDAGIWGALASGDGYDPGMAVWIGWGQSGDIIVPGDFDGDGMLDPTVRRPPAGGQSAVYMMLLSSTGYDYGQAKFVPAGWPGLQDTPVPADYNGDGITDPAIFRGKSGVWIIPLSPNFNTYKFASWGATGDIPIGADVDGDGIADVGYYRPSTGMWGFLPSSHVCQYCMPVWFSWGSSSDTPMMADYDGDGKADPAVVTPPAAGQSAAYRILLSGDSYDYDLTLTVPAGWPGLGDTPVNGDYDGDDLIDPGIWRSSTGIWILPKSSFDYLGYIFSMWGAAGDQVVH